MEYNHALQDKNYLLAVQIMVANPTSFTNEEYLSTYKQMVRQAQLTLERHRSGSFPASLPSLN